MRFFIAEATNEVKFDVAGNLISKDGFLHHRRNFQYHVLILVKEGVLYINQNGTDYAVGKNQYIVLKAGEEHVGYKKSEGRLSYLWVHFTFPSTVNVAHTLDWNQLKTKYMNPVMGNYLLKEYGEIASTQRALLLFNQLLDLSRQEKQHFQKMNDYALSLLLMEISVEIIDQYESKEKSLPIQIRRVMDWVKSNYNEEVSIASIAAEFTYHPDYLSSLFKKTTGQSLIHYINGIRIMNAKSLLTNYDVSIKEAAFSCGFSDEKYFMKVFKKMEGVTPLEYKSAFFKKYKNHG